MSTFSFRKAGTFVVSFGFSKAGAFAAAVALPRFVDTQTYGLLELSMTVASLAAAVLGLGAPTFAARAFLLENDRTATTILIGHAMLLSFLGVGLSLVLVLLGANNLYLLCASMLGSFGLQASASTYVRMHSNVFLAGWFDAFVLMAMVASALMLWLGGVATGENIAAVLILLSAVISFTALRFVARVSWGDLKTMIGKAARGGAPMMFYGLSIIILFGTPRMAIGHGLGFKEVAVFSVCARVTSVLLFANQVFQIGLVRYLYRLDNSSLARIFPYWTIALCLAATILTVAGYFGSDILVIGTNIPREEVTAVFPGVIVLTTFAILNANVEMYVNREMASNAAARALIVIFSVLVGIGLLVQHLGVLTLSHVIALYSAAMAVALLAQMRILRRHGLSFGWSSLVLPLAVLPWIVHFLPVRN